jgi:hypothetical protein
MPSCIASTPVCDRLARRHIEKDVRIAFLAELEDQYAGIFD